MQVQASDKRLPTPFLSLAIREGTPGIVLVNPDAVALSKRLVKRFSIPEIVLYFDMEQFVQANRGNVLTQFA